MLWSLVATCSLTVKSPNGKDKNQVNHLMINGKHHCLPVVAAADDILSLSTKGWPSPPPPLLEIYGHIHTDPYQPHILSELMFPFPPWASLSTDTWPCQVHNSAGDIVLLLS